MRRSQRLIIELLNGFHALEVVLQEGGVLPGHDFDVVGFLGVPARPKQEDEALPLQREQLQVAKVKPKLADSVTVICVLWIVLSVVTSCVPLVAS